MQLLTKKLNPWVLHRALRRDGLDLESSESQCLCRLGTRLRVSCR